MKTAEKKIKSFDQVQIGDKAYDCDCLELQGKILAKGSFDELSKTYESNWSKEDIFDGEEDEDILKALEQCVAISQDPEDTMEGFTSYIFLYDFDPSSVCCFE